MKGLKRKWNAFTLSEMLIVLLLTVIVVSLAFTILNLVQKQMYSAQENYQTKTEFNLLRQALWKDFRTYPKIYFQTEEQRLVLENELARVDYYFMKDYLIRGKDTFDVQLKGKILFWDGLEVEKGPINALELISKEDMGTKHVFVYRANAADLYMNR